MTYSLGPVHALSGQGVLTVAAPVGLLAMTSAVGPAAGIRMDTPPSYWGLGHLRPGNADGWFSSQRLETLATLIYPLPTPVDRIGYTLGPGVTINLQELLDVPANWTKMPWDRNATQWKQSGFAGAIAGGTGAVTMWTYTVPVGRRLIVDVLNVRLQRNVAATTVVAATATMALNGDGVLQVAVRDNVVGSRIADSIGGQMICAAGDVLSFIYANSDAGGSIQTASYAHGLLFDA